jgi:23S rRNA (cytidine1920-2'-O)/16S rRNA (cytidine1409-2'-O)-methyltransferase
MASDKKTRLDQALLARGLAPDLKEARALIMAGEVLVNGQKADKSDRPVAALDGIALRERCPYVSRGALKIEMAVRELGIEPAGLSVLDIGISTGGFSDFFLQHGAARVLGVDVTVSQVDARQRADARLGLLRKNARFLRPEDVPFPPDLVVMDLSFISIAVVLPALAAFPRARVLALVKPQFEAPRGGVGRGGVVRDKAARRAILLRLKRRIEELDFGVLGACRAGVRGRRGNQEYFFLLRQGKKSSIDDTMIADACEI